MQSELSNPAGAASPLLIVDSLTLAYSRASILGSRTAKTTALRDISFELGQGEILGLVGPSGSGKSTLARSLVLLEKPETGAIYFRNRNLLQLKERELRTVRREIQLIFQDSVTAMNPEFKIEEVIGEPLEIHGPRSREQRAKRIKQTMDKLQLPRLWLERRPHELSGGQRQRVALARALVVQPSILILDEALSALDLSAQNQIVNLLLEQQQGGSLSCLFITHDLRLARCLAGRVITLRSGSISSESTDEAFTRKLQAPQENVAANHRKGETLSVNLNSPNK